MTPRELREQVFLLLFRAEFYKRADGTDESSGSGGTDGYV